MEKKAEEPSQDEYYFTQQYLPQVNPDATEIAPYIQQVNRFVYVSR